MDFTIREAQPEDAPFLAWAMLTAARSHLTKGWFDIVLDAPEEACMKFLERLAVTEARSWWHFSRFKIAETNGHPAAALCGFRADEGYPLSQAAMIEVGNALGMDESAQQAIWERSAYLFTCIMEPHDDFWTIENVATLPEYRGRGFAGRLIRHVLDEGREQGYRNAQITFLIGNEAAERTYAKAGFHFDVEKRHPDFEAATGSPGLRRFIRDILP
jgi:ribosomal protein S18 acetylase RimI-like enzyme